MGDSEDQIARIIRSQLSEGEELLVASKGRVRYSSTPAGTFWSIALVVRGVDLIRRPLKPPNFERNHKQRVYLWIGG
jgi:hypothetical protein